MTNEMYQWTRFEADFTARQKAQGYETSVVEFQIVYNHPGQDLRTEPEYSDAEEAFLDLTMSCNPQEAKNWMAYWMANAIAYGIQTKKRDWQHKFLAAYDIFNSLCKQYPTAATKKFAEFNQFC